MPDFHGISMHLESQYDVKQIQEFYPSSPPPLTNTTDHARKQVQLSAVIKSFYKNNRGNGAQHAASHDQQQPITEGRPKSPLIEAHVPTYPNSQFWLTYRINPELLLQPTTLPKLPQGNDRDLQVRYVYFKLILPSRTGHHALGSDDTNSRVVSWGVGAKEDWKGKTMFGLFRTRHDASGKSSVDKRGFWFSEDRHTEGEFDVQIFRARGRRRASRLFPDMTAKTKEGSEVKYVDDQKPPLMGMKDIPAELRRRRLVNIGRLKEFAPQRYYQYALIDSVDEPYVTFRYRLRSKDKLEAEGIFPGRLHNPMETRHFIPNEAEEQHMTDAGSTTHHQQSRDSTSVYYSAEENYGEEEEHCDQALSDDEDSIGGNISPSTMRPLSFPPTIRLVSSTSSNEPHSPAKDYGGKDPVKAPFIKSLLDSDGSFDAADGEPADDDGFNTTFLNSCGELSILTGEKADYIRSRAIKTPSPDTTIESPPSTARRLGHGHFLIDVLGSAMKRKAVCTTPARHETTTDEMDQDNGYDNDKGRTQEEDKRSKYEAIRESW